MNYKLLKVNLRAFEGETVNENGGFDMNVHTTGTESLSAEMKLYYDSELLHAAGPRLVHGQFGQKKPIPRGRGKTIEFRKFSQLPKQSLYTGYNLVSSGYQNVFAIVWLAYVLQSGS